MAARACAILTGIGTVLHDDPLLNLRMPQAESAALAAATPPDSPGCATWPDSAPHTSLPASAAPLHQPLRQPHLVVLDSQLRTPPSARLFGVPNRKVWICASQQLDQPIALHPASARADACCHASDGARSNAHSQTASGHATGNAAETAISRRAAALQAAGAEIIWLPANAQGRPELRALLQELARREVNELHVEAGAALNGALLQGGHVDEMLAYIAPLLLGPGRPLADLPELHDLSASARWQLRDAHPLGNDVRLRLRRAS